MAGMASNLGGSSSSNARKLEEKRKLSDTRSEEAKKQRHDPQLNATAHPNGGAAITVVPPPLHHAASNAMAVAFPVAGVNGAALRWSTAATLGAAASRAAAAALPPPVMAGVNGPAAPFVLAPVPVLQQAAPGAASKALPPPPPVASVNGGVTAPLQAISSGPIAGGASNPPPAPAASLPLAAALGNINDDTLRRMLSEVMLSCDPPMRRRQSWTGAPPPWWPTASGTTPVPFAPAYKLNKVQKVAVLVAIVKHHAPNLHRLSRRLSDSDAKLWNTAVENEAAEEPEPEQQQEQHSNGDMATAALDDDEDDGHQQPITISSFPGDGGAPLGDDNVNQVAVEAPKMQPEDEQGEMRANDAAAADMDEEPCQLLEDMMEPCQVLEDMLAPYQEQQGEEVHQAVSAEEPGAEAAAGEAQEDRPWYVEEDMSSFFDDFEMLVEMPKLD